MGELELIAMRLPGGRVQFYRLVWGPRWSLAADERQRGLDVGAARAS